MAISKTPPFLFLLAAFIIAASTSTNDARVILAGEPAPRFKVAEPPIDPPIGAPIYTPIGAPEPYVPCPHKSFEMCEQECENSVSECVVDSCLHIPSGDDQAFCISECTQELSSCKYGCQQADEGDVPGHKY
ncbi:uncharacterized protein A4U43_C08F22280 [Asparagus officinalis]|nr:uncharacterized protein A4U43_C08F22280 [Asparagus officinalis]